MYQTIHMKYQSCFPYLEISSSGQHRLDSSHSVIVMVLGGQLLRAQSVDGHDLHRQRTGLDETAGIQGDLRNQGIIRYHHSHCSEEGLIKWMENFVQFQLESSIRSYWWDGFLNFKKYLKILGIINIIGVWSNCLNNYMT